MSILDNYSDELVERDGIHFAKKESEISYPKGGNQQWFQIEENSFWFKHRNQCILSLVEKHSPKELFFDIGGGNGFIAKWLENNNINTVLVEPGIQGCVNAKERGLTNVVCSTLEDAEFKENSIKAIGLFDVVEHTPNDVEFMKLIASNLASEGLVYITVPSYNLLWSNEDKDVGHFRRYTLKRMKKVLIEAGFEINYATYIFSILPIPIFFFRTIPSFLGFNKNSNDLSKHQNEHKEYSGFVNSILNKIWNCEIKRVRLGKKLCFGGSCLVVAKKL